MHAVNMINAFNHQQCYSKFDQCAERSMASIVNDKHGKELATDDLALAHIKEEAAKEADHRAKSAKLQDKKLHAVAKIDVKK